MHYSYYIKSPPSRLSFLKWKYIFISRHNMSGQTQYPPAKTSNLPDKCPMTGANLQACWSFRQYNVISIYQEKHTNTFVIFPARGFCGNFIWYVLEKKTQNNLTPTFSFINCLFEKARLKIVPTYYLSFPDKEAVILNQIVSWLCLCLKRQDSCLVRRC